LKAAERPAAFVCARCREGQSASANIKERPAAPHTRLELRVVAVVVLHGAVAPALEASAIALAESLHVMMRAQHARENDEPDFLVIFEALIKGRAGVRDLFQRN